MRSATPTYSTSRATRSAGARMRSSRSRFSARLRSGQRCSVSVRDGFGAGRSSVGRVESSGWPQSRSGLPSHARVTPPDATVAPAARLKAAMTVVSPPGIALEELTFSNAFAGLGERFYESRTPSGLENARLVAVSPDAAALIDLPESELTRDEFIRLASGARILRGMQPFAALYGGHQFGVWAGQLGDGRAIALGEITNKRGEPWEIQLKGAGQTAYSRFADGRAVLRSTIREFLASEAMDALGIPTTRALAMVANDEPVIRESIETAAIVVRLALSFVRFGSFEIFAARGEHDAIRILADFVIDRFYPECGTGDDRYARFFEAVLKRTARLMAHWQSVGFMHGVMNTDNFSILALTLDYGPYGFMEGYEPG